MSVDLAFVPDGYEPEPWDVVREDGVVIIRGVGIAAADNGCAYLNANPATRFHGVHRYEVVPARLVAAKEARE